ncbi:LysR substrate-binding domain-containing protein [Burkholderia aenigmatica]|uniref:LysR substrate-binding domain-containing protein n=1 Tax=Burkholderia aenigmatica TaxID=2015348 RepID=UPI001F3CFA24|nr:LysR substrate-binding domain-containing protein [Burkholderia aenigmatica]UKD15833.1 LysR substrate-binding domain-containing protein [Burkholderia aenigmatica]
MEDLSDLAYFVQAAEHGGFAAAERATGIPKSKLSRRVAELEARLGIRLIQRSTRRFAVTEIGQRTLQHARAMLAEAEAALALSAEYTAAPRGPVRLSCPPALLQNAVADMLAKFLCTWPDVVVRVESTNRKVDLWHDGVDVALRVRFAAPDGTMRTTHADEIVKPLARSSHVLVAAPELMTSVAPPTIPADLERLPTLGLGNSTDESYWTLIGPAGEHAEVQHTPRLVANDVSSLLSAALAGVGCASLPRELVHSALIDRQLVEVLPGWAPPAGIVQAAFASRQGMRPAVREMLDFLAKEFERLASEGRYLPIE